ncbi:ABC transporter permease [Mesorhizobium sp. RP14(2022)]|jgi:ribose/xylose/arabinose/galactoside ABC-type transport system permease subunit|uniref:ABC transporter permease n=1 Tax=Mesorhizobium liriopis TaxID=2953882 RepID=A0ABT1C4C0_9HYPH|nr:ABC transporter permease [Mesorhizobium liriopis]MCO6049680.1 ABC transporter permease [Mesorhizobium liriopis]
MTITPVAETATGATQPPSVLRRLGRLMLSEYFVLVLCVAYVLAIAPFVPEILSWEVASNILSDMMPLLVVAIGQTFVLIIAGIDLSVTAIVSMSAVVGASVMTGTGGYLGDTAFAVPGAVLAMLFTGLVIGAINGFSVIRLNMPSFIVTLATRMFFAGAAVWYVTFHSTSSSIANLPESFAEFATGHLFGIPLTVIAAGLIAVVAHVVLSRTRFGRAVYAVGANPRAARVSGIPVERTILFCFLISGVCASVAATIYVSRMQTGSPIVGENILLDVIGAVVIGGTSLFGGKGKIVWTVFGVLFLLLLDTSMKLLGASLFAIYIIKGGVILLAALVDVARNRWLVGR